MGGSNKSQTQTIRYAPYIEEHHTDFLSIVAAQRDKLLLDADLDGQIDSSPYAGYSDIEIESAFFGLGYALNSYPTLYDMFGKFMAGLDIEVLFDESLEDLINGPVVHEVISQEADFLNDDLEQEALPRFEVGMRDINAVLSSSFVVGRAMMETARTKAISRFSADLRGRLLPVAVTRWQTHLEWNRSVIEMYAQLMKFYLISKMDTDNHNLEVAAKNTLWPFTVLEYDRAAIGALTGAQNVTTDVAGASRAAKAIGGAMVGAGGGALLGAEIGAAGGPIGMGLGALIGGVVGLIGGLVG